ncbi:MAG: glutathione S-transferase family protein [Proteobacteria bacterium]|nr:glutathione S-transferase family protein [Pseudomonadota bacterium]
MVNLELVSFNVCPFVQRSVITLNHKGCEYGITFIDLANPPDWFLQISPLGKVPVLKVDDSEVLFESAVINEFVDDVTPGTLKPSDPLTLAKNRAWIEFGGTCLADLYMMADAKTENEMRQQMNVCKERLQHVENILTGAVFFNGDDFALVDAAYAPLLIRLDSICEKIDFLDWNHFPKLNRWKENLLALESVQKSVIEDFESHYTNKIRAQNGYLGSLL